MADHALGICIGSTTVSAACVRADGSREILRRSARAHHGDPLGTVTALWQEMAAVAPRAQVAVTGRSVSQQVRLPHLFETRAVELALADLGLIGGPQRRVASVGGEMILIYRLDREGRVESVNSGNKCASGTGEFFLQQIGRMDLSLAEAGELAPGGMPIALSKRCSVFCKSDCTHALNKGRAKADVVAGLCRVIADKVTELVGDGADGHLVLIGGCARNQGVVRMLASRFTHLAVPDEPDCIEALGAALYAIDHGEERDLKAELPPVEAGGGFHRLPPLPDAAGLVEHAGGTPVEPRPDQECIVGLDVGSTTTKAVLMHRDSCAVWARVYLRTGGDPVGASQRCYRALLAEQPPGTRVVGLGVTGSGRALAGLHALTPAVINEIIAHARAAAHFDPEVDTIFEIGGQDAKYTFLTEGVPSDYAMNEACSAGTGSFLEEAAKESFGVATEAIGDRALTAERPPQFNEQCAAFISSDIKVAINQGLTPDEVLAGLVYSVCRNYINKVKGNRPVGRKVIMQGGVCYNRAVPLAMAALLGKPLVVPPDPGLMGAHGVALEVRDRLAGGVLSATDFDLAELAERPFRHVRTFTCPGGKERCDLGCDLDVIEIQDRKYIFGGLCRRYEKLALGQKAITDIDALEGIAARQKLVYGRNDEAGGGSDDRPTMGINRSFLTSVYFPFYHAFFSALGYRVVLSGEVKEAGLRRLAAAFCYPVELAHGLFQDLVDRHPDHIFLPHVTHLDVEADVPYKRACVFVQGEPYVLRASFPHTLRSPRVHTPKLDFGQGLEGGFPALASLARELGHDASTAATALARAAAAQRSFVAGVEDLGRKLIERVEADTDREDFGVVLFGRPYNALDAIANMGIPRKLAGFGIPVIPYDGLPWREQEDHLHMYWGVGQTLLKAASYVATHPRLYGVFISNFSCGPDSFLLGQFRDIMGAKPSLTLELDSHTADAGVDTRIEAFLDVVRCHRRLSSETVGIARDAASGDAGDDARSTVRIGTPLPDGRVHVGGGKAVDLFAPGVKILLPEMGKLGTQALAAAFRSKGLDCEPLPTPDAETLKLGRANTTCKECLPLILTLGSFIQHLERRTDPEEFSVFFMPSATGPCRFGQYAVFIDTYLRKSGTERAGIFSLVDESLYAEFGTRFQLNAWRAVVAADMLENMRHMLAVTAADPERAETVLQEQWCELRTVIEDPERGDFYRQLDHLARALRALPLVRNPADAPTVTLVGEIFVRKEAFSRSEVVQHLQERGFVVRVVPVREYLHYNAWLINNGYHQQHHSLGQWMSHHIAGLVRNHVERRVERILRRSDLCPHPDTHVGDAIKAAEWLIDPHLMGEAILTVGTSMKEILETSCGIIALGPFGCMPTRLAQSLLERGMTLGGKLRSARDPSLRKRFGDLRQLPQLFIETDGNAFPQITQARLETFMLQAERVHLMMSRLRQTG